MRITSIDVEQEFGTKAFFDALAKRLDSDFAFSVAEVVLGVIKKKHKEAKKFQRMFAPTRPNQDPFISLVAEWYEVGTDAIEASIAQAREALGIKGSVYSCSAY